MTFGERLKQLRDERGLTQDDIAQLLNVERSTVTGYETRGREPDYAKLIKLARYFDVLVDYLIGNGDARQIGARRIYSTEELIKMLPQEYQELFEKQNIGYVKFTNDMIEDQIDPETLKEIIELTKNVRKQKTNKEE